MVREAKVAAAREGKTLGKWVSERLAEATGLADDAKADSLQADMAWLEENRTAVERSFGGRYAAIVNGKVIDHDERFDRLAQRVFEKLGPRSIYMPKLGRQEIRLRSPRRAGAHR